MAFHSNSVLFDENSFDVGPPPKPIYFAWTKSVNSMTRNYKIWFLRILKHLKKNKENSKVARQKEKGDQILLKMGFWVLKTLRMKALETWSYLKPGI